MRLYCACKVVRRSLARLLSRDSTSTRKSRGFARMCGSHAYPRRNRDPGVSAQVLYCLPCRAAVCTAFEQDIVVSGGVIIPDYVYIRAQDGDLRVARVARIIAHVNDGFPRCTVVCTSPEKDVGISRSAVLPYNEPVRA